ncbi:MAG: hypothetical protein K9G46_07135 [Flavobacteriales bacterium]|nr:hypothetical protein [Flavobacteriales bacterium]
MARTRNPNRVLNNCLWLPTLLGWPNGPSAEAQDRCIDKAFGAKTAAGAGTSTYTLAKSEKTITTTTEKQAMVSVAGFLFAIGALIALAYGVSKLIPD